MCAGSFFCALTSAFLVPYMLFIGVLVSKDYSYASTAALVHAWDADFV
jgi:hypothetical protein